MTSPADTADIGLIGLGVMGANLARNMAGKGHRVACYDADPKRRAALVDGEMLLDFASPGDLLAAISPPRPVLMLVPAGSPVDAVIASLTPHLAPGDILIDAGNSDFHDTRRRTGALEDQGFAFLGMGISGGAEGALNGPAIMAGGSPGTWSRIAPVLTSIAAHHQGTPCADWLGPDGAGHFVKTVHNGIEYADMQMIAEIYGILRDGFALPAPRIGEIFAGWNKGPLASYLTEITALVASTTDDRTGAPLLDRIADIAGQKGTGRWSVIEAQHLGAAATTIEAAVAARNLSGETATRRALQTELPDAGALAATLDGEAAAMMIDSLQNALLAGRIIAYAQGFDLLAKASAQFDWALNPAQIARLWRAGCIIRSAMLDDMAAAFETGAAANLMTLPPLDGQLRGAIPSLRATATMSANFALSAPALTGALAYHDQLARDRGTANLLQALRDCFGQHGFRRTDADGDGHHGPWVSG